MPMMDLLGVGLGSFDVFLIIIATIIGIPYSLVMIWNGLEINKLKFLQEIEK